MSDQRAVVRLFDELLWVLRREGFPVSTAQAVTAIEALAAIGLERPHDVREALKAVVVCASRERAHFDRVFSEFFAPERIEKPCLAARLRALGFGPAELDVLSAALEAMRSSSPDAADALQQWLGARSFLDQLLATSATIQQTNEGALPRVGFLTHRVVERGGGAMARKALASLRLSLRADLGSRGDGLADALARELSASEETIGHHIARAIRRRSDALEAEASVRGLEMTPFSALTQAEAARMRDAVRALASRLAATARLRTRRARRGALDSHATLRRALETCGVPMRPRFRRRRRNRPRLVLLCDVSDSVRATAAFLLDFANAAQELFPATRTFVFVSDVGEVTSLFASAPAEEAFAAIWSGTIVPTAHESHYGRALRQFEAKYLPAIDRRTTLVLLGDGRTNYFDSGVEVLERFRRRARALVWLATEPRAHWHQGDSAMSTYAGRCSTVLEVGCVADLERAARLLLHIPSAGG